MEMVDGGVVQAGSKSMKRRRLIVVGGVLLALGILSWLGIAYEIPPLLLLNILLSVPLGFLLSPLPILAGKDGLLVGIAPHAAQYVTQVGALVLLVVPGLVILTIGVQRRRRLARDVSRANDP
jgi:hypothetical protein